MQSRVREGRLGFVPVRFGDEVVGGAEMLMRELAAGLAERGWAVDVLTGCTRDYFREVNAYSPGCHPTFRTARASCAFRVWRRRAGPTGSWETVDWSGARTLGTDAAYRWLNDDVRVPGSVRVPRRPCPRVPRADLCSRTCTGRRWRGRWSRRSAPCSIPCLHDEPTARLPIYDRMFRDVRGCWFLTEPEAESRARCGRTSRLDGDRIGRRGARRLRAAAVPQPVRRRRPFRALRGASRVGQGFRPVGGAVRRRRGT